MRKPPMNIYLDMSRRCLWILLLILLTPLPGLAGQPATVIAAAARLETLSDDIELLGTLRANETVEISATVADTITLIHFDDGQFVEKGKILAEMTNNEEHAQLEEEISNLAEAEKQYNRVAPLVERGAASQSLLDQRQKELAAARARLKAIESRLRDRLIIAPFSGVVGLRSISVGALVAPGDVITTLDDISVMKLDFSVPAVKLTLLRTGAPIEARSAAFGEKVFTGIISGIDSRIDPITRSIVVRATIDNPDGLLKPGLLMRVMLRGETRLAVTIAEEALVPTGRSNMVFVVDNSQPSPVVRQQEVRIGSRMFGRVEIVSGLDGGELVVTHGTTRVRPGQDVAVLQEDGNEPLSDILNGAVVEMR
jgi:membrane fusion protein (multidrug efflux system)